MPELACHFCGNHFVGDKPTRKYCSHKCSVDHRSKKAAQEKASQKCIINGCDRPLFCKELCGMHYQRSLLKGLHANSPPRICEGCGNEFRSYYAKKFCSNSCYVSTPYHAALMDEHRRMSAEARGVVIGERVKKKCPNCGKEKEFLVCDHKRGRRFCSRLCSREWYSKRYDRWVAEPKDATIPSNYDEFLAQNELPCLIVGCDWVGRSLGYHVNKEHGITADEFKKMCGFNKTTGLVCPELSRELSERTVGDPTINEKVERPKNYDRYTRRLEAKEHWLKARLVNMRPIKCISCGDYFESFAYNARYCKKPKCQLAKGRLNETRRIRCRKNTPIVDTQPVAK